MNNQKISVKSVVILCVYANNANFSNTSFCVFYVLSLLIKY